MKNYIIISLLGLSSLCASAAGNALPPDSVSLGYAIAVDEATTAFVLAATGRATFANAPQVDAAKALYGRIPGLNVYQGSGVLADNYATLSFHGKAPLVLVDGFPRSLSSIRPQDIESVEVLKDAVSASLYGVRGANGIVNVITRRGKAGKMRAAVQYQFGVNTQFRAPEFADAYTYGRTLNSALASDGMALRYNAWELQALREGNLPEYFPNVDWWHQVYRDKAYNHQLNLTFDGGTNRFRYFTTISYLHDRGFFRSTDNTSRYNTDPTDVRLNVRSNIDVDITTTTLMHLNVAGCISETNRANYGDIYNAVYNTPSAAFPVKYHDGTYGTAGAYGANNPVALLKSTGNYKLTIGTLLADLSLRQKLDFITPGLTVEGAVAFDNVGTMYDQSTDTYLYRDEQAALTADGTLTTRPVTYGKISEQLTHGNSFRSMYMRADARAKISYNRTVGPHDISANIIYDFQNYIANGRNNSTSRQSVPMMAGYTYGKRYNVNVSGTVSGSAYLPDGDKNHFYPAVNAAWIVSNEAFMSRTSAIDLLKIGASYGKAGWDGKLSHELWRHYYGNSNAGGYYFSNNISHYSGMAEGSLPAENLMPEEATTTTVSAQLKALRNRLDISVEGFFERRKGILVSGASDVSGIIGINVGPQSSGIHEYRGVDFGISWNDKCGDFSYGLYANGSYIDSRIVNDGRGFQAYNYLYHIGDRVGQCYGLEVVGIFNSQMEINNSTRQSFSTVAPGDFKYRDQNGDNVIDDNDVVKMYGSTIPRFYFGFGLQANFKGIELSADFQGLTGRTVNLLDCPLYKPLVNNGNISQTFLNNEVPWSPEHAADATMPRLTTLANANNYRNNSAWYRDGSFIKLRNLTLAYTISRKVLRFADIKVYLQGTNLFSLDKLKTVDPEQLGATYPSLRSYWAGLVFNF